MVLSRVLHSHLVHLLADTRSKQNEPERNSEGQRYTDTQFEREGEGERERGRGKEREKKRTGEAENVPGMWASAFLEKESFRPG